MEAVGRSTGNKLSNNSMAIGNLNKENLSYFCVSKNKQEVYFLEQLIIYTTSQIKIARPNGISIANSIAEFQRLISNFICILIHNSF